MPISDMVSDILNKRMTRAANQKKARTKAKEDAPNDKATVRQDFEDIAKEDIKVTEKPESPKPTQKTDSEETVPAVPQVGIPDSNAAMFVQRFLANVSDSSLELTKQQLADLEHDIKNLNVSASTTILRCKGAEDCVYGKFCSLDKIKGTFPIGEICPMEKTIAEISFNEYLVSLNKTMDDVGIIEFNQIMSLIECDLLDMRSRSRLNEEGMTRMVTTFVNHKTGDTAETEELSVMFGIKDRVAKRRDTILKQMLATPEIRAKYKIADVGDRGRKDARQLVKEAREKLIELKQDK